MRESRVQFPAGAHGVMDEEFFRLLGYPPGHVPGDRARELARWARAWYRAHGRAWAWYDEVALAFTGDELRLGGRSFRSPRLLEHLRATGATRAMLLAVSAGPECEAEARRLWEAQRPDEYFFLETFGSAVVEQLVADANGRVCEEAARHALVVVPHYSPGYTGWDVAEQPALFDLISTRMTAGGWPGPLEVLPSGMLRPKKSMLAVIGLAPRRAEVSRPLGSVPCERCAFSPCQFRRAAYRHRPMRIDGAPVRPQAVAPRYTLNPRVLAKWAGERLDLCDQPDGTLLATFRFDGTTCSNLGHPLAFAYRVHLDAAVDRRAILDCTCTPLSGDAGYARMCAFLASPTGLMGAIARERPLVGRPLDAVLGWDRPAGPAGCLCDAAGRARTWGIALEVIHYALGRRGARHGLAPAGACAFP